MNKFIKTKGFTIVELLIVIVVIAILAAIATLSYRGIQDRAQLSVAQAEVASVQKKIQLYKTENGFYPGSVSDCPTPSAGNTCVSSLVADSFFYKSYSTNNIPYYEFTSLGKSQFQYTSKGERYESDEHMRYMDMAPIIDRYGLKEYEISFDAKSADTSSENTMLIYNSDGGGSKYRGLNVRFPITNSYTNHSISFTPDDNPNGTSSKFSVSFYGTYGTGNRPYIKNMKIKFK